MRKLLVLFFVAGLAWAGCGGDEDGAGKVDTAPEASSDSKSDAEAAATGLSGEGSDGFCQLARKYDTDFQDTPKPQTPADVEKEYTALTAAVERLAADAPAEIKADTERVSGAFGDMNDLLAEYGYEFSKIPDAEAEKMDIGSPQIEQASQQVQSYFERVCKIDSDGDGDTDGVTDAPSTTGVTTDTTSPG